MIPRYPDAMCCLMISMGLISCSKVKPTPSPKPTPISEQSDAIKDQFDIGEFKGYTLIDRTIKDRLINHESSFQLSHYLEKKAYSGTYEEALDVNFPSLKDLLGKNEGAGLSDGYKNGKPNSLNMLLWFVVFGGLAREIDTACDYTFERFNEHATSLFKQLCIPPQDSASRDLLLEDTWLLLMGNDAPPSEYMMWRQFLISENLWEQQRRQRFINVIVAAYYNPHFLLRK